MSGTDSEPKRFSQYSIEIECPGCHDKMTVAIGLMGDPKNNLIECLCCKGEFVPLVPGQIVAGPFQASQ
jgi:hypothetical protein